MYSQGYPYEWRNQPLWKRRIALWLGVAMAAVFVYRIWQLSTLDELPVKPPVESRELLGD